jgi:hypothetical protein
VEQLKKQDESKLKDNYGISNDDQSEKEPAEKIKTCKVICKLMKNGSFILIALSLSCLFYIVTGI